MPESLISWGQASKFKFVHCIPHLSGFRSTRYPLGCESADQLCRSNILPGRPAKCLQSTSTYLFLSRYELDEEIAFPKDRIQLQFQDTPPSFKFLNRELYVSDSQHPHRRKVCTSFWASVCSFVRILGVNTYPLVCPSCSFLPESCCILLRQTRRGFFFK